MNFAYFILLFRFFAIWFWVGCSPEQPRSSLESRQNAQTADESQLDQAPSIATSSDSDVAQGSDISTATGSDQATNTLSTSTSSVLQASDLCALRGNAKLSLNWQVDGRFAANGICTHESATEYNCENTPGFFLNKDGSCVEEAVAAQPLLASKKACNDFNFYFDSLLGKCTGETQVQYSCNLQQLFWNHTTNQCVLLGEGPPDPEYSTCVDEADSNCQIDPTNLMNLCLQKSLVSPLPLFWHDNGATRGVCNDQSDAVYDCGIRGVGYTFDGAECTKVGTDTDVGQSISKCEALGFYFNMVKNQCTGMSKAQYECIETDYWLGNVKACITLSKNDFVNRNACTLQNAFYDPIAKKCSVDKSFEVALKDSALLCLKKKESYNLATRSCFDPTTNATTSTSNPSTTQVQAIVPVLSANSSSTPTLSDSTDGTSDGSPAQGSSSDTGSFSSTVIHGNGTETDTDTDTDTGSGTATDSNANTGSSSGTSTDSEVGVHIQHPPVLELDENQDVGNKYTFVQQTSVTSDCSQVGADRIWMYTWVEILPGSTLSFTREDSNGVLNTITTSVLNVSSLDLNVWLQDPANNNLVMQLDWINNGVDETWCNSTSIFTVSLATLGQNVTTTGSQLSKAAIRAQANAELLTMTQQSAQFESQIKPIIKTMQTTAPITSLSTLTSSLTNTTSATFKFTCNQKCTFLGTLDNSAIATAINSPYTVADLTSGPHSFQVQATNLLKKVEIAPPSYNWVVDTTLPTTKIANCPVGITNNTSDTTVILSCVSKNQPCTYESNLDAAGWVTITTSSSDTIKVSSQTGLAGTPHSYSARAHDKLGNIDVVPPTCSWTLDTISPTTSLSQKPEAKTKNSVATFAFAANESSTYEINLDNASVWTTLTPSSQGFTCDSSLIPVCTYTYTVSGSTSPAASHTFKVRATDLAKNTEAAPYTATYTWTVDTTQPLTTPITCPAALTNVINYNFPLSCTSNNTPCTFESKLDSGNWTPTTTSSIDSFVIPVTTAQAGTSHTYSIHAIDSLGNVDLSSNIPNCKWTVDNMLPLTTFSQTPAGVANVATANFVTNNTTATFVFSSKEPSTYETLVDSSTTWQTLTSTSLGLNCVTASASSVPVCTYTYIANGSTTAVINHTLVVRATDLAKNIEVPPQNSNGVYSATYSWKVDTIPPGTTMTGCPSPNSQSIVSVNTPTTFTIGCNSTHTPCSYESLLDTGSWTPFTPTANQVIPSIANPSQQAGDKHTFSVRAKDSWNTYDPNPPACTWVFDNVLPTTTLSSQLPKALSNNNIVTFVFSANEPSTFEMSTDQKTWSALTPSTQGFSCNIASPQVCTFVYTPNVIDSTYQAYTMQFRAKDNAKNVEAPISTSSDGTQVYKTFASWATDSRTPTTTMVSCPSPDHVNIKSINYVPSFTVGYTAQGNNTPYTYYQQLDAATAWTQIIPDGASKISLNSLISSTLDQAGKSHTLILRVQDGLNNFDPKPVSCTWIYDKVPPQTSFLTNVPPKNIGGSAANTASFSFSVNEPTSLMEATTDGTNWFPLVQNTTTGFSCLPSGVCTYTYTPISTASFSTTTNGITTPTPGLWNLTFRVRATDIAQNTEGKLTATNDYNATYPWTVDTRPPTTTTFSGCPSVANNSLPTFTLDCTSLGKNYPCTYSAQIDGSSWNPITVTNKLYTPIITSPDILGNSHTINFKATDFLLNDEVGAFKTCTWTLDTVAPTTTVTKAPPSVTKSTNAYFEFSANETSTFEVSLNQGSTWTKLTPTSASFYCIDSGTNAPATASCKKFSYQYTVSGSTTNAINYTFEIRATDLVQNVEISNAPNSIWTWTVDQRLPVAVIASGCPSTGATVANINTSDFKITPACNIATCPNTPITYFGSLNGGAATQLTLDANNQVNVHATPVIVNSLTDSTVPIVGTNYKYTIYAVDSIGNQGAVSPACSWMLDVVPPTTFFSTQPNTKPANPSGGTSGLNPVFVFHANKTTTTFQAIIDGKTVSLDKDPGLSCDKSTLPICTYTYSLNQSIGSSGSHSFKVFATDLAGNVEQMVQSTGDYNASYTWTVDEVAPVTSVLNCPAPNAQGIRLTNKSAILDVKCTKNNAPSTCTFQSKLDISGWSSLAFDPGTTEFVTPVGSALTALAGDAHSYYVIASDSLGNQEVAPTIPNCAWTYDNNTPITTITNPPVTPTGLNTAAFSMSVNEATSLVEVQVQQGSSTILPWTNITLAKDIACSNSTCSNFVYTTPLATSAAVLTSFTLSLRSTDLAGNIELPHNGGNYVATSWNQDNRKPVTALSGCPSSGSQYVNTIPKMTLSCASSNKPCTYQYQVGNGAMQSLMFDDGSIYDNGNGATAPAISPGVMTPNVSMTTPLGGQQYTYSVVAIDSLKNKEATPATAVCSFTLETLKPTTQFTKTPLTTPAPGLLTASTNASFQFSVSEFPSKFEQNIDNAGWIALTTMNCIDTNNPCLKYSYDYTVSPLSTTAVIQHSLQIRTTDQAGNTEASVTTTPAVTYSASFSWNVDNRPPIINNPMLGCPSQGATVANINFTDFKLTPTCSTLNSPCAYFGLLDSGTTKVFPQLTLDASGNVNVHAGGSATAQTGQGHIFSIYAVDTLGNQGPTVSCNWNLDVVPPLATITAMPPLFGKNTVGTSHFEFHANEASTFDIRYQLNNGAWTPVFKAFGDLNYNCYMNGTTTSSTTANCTNYSVDIPVTGSSIAIVNYALSIIPRDQAGNPPDRLLTSYPSTYGVSYVWNINNVVPVINITSQPSANNNQTLVSDGIISFNCSVTGPGNSCTTKGHLVTGTTTGTDVTITSPYTLPGYPLAGGAYSYVVIATDAVGNTATATSSAWIVNTTAPVITISGVTASSTTNKTSLPLILGCTGKTCTYATVDVATPTTGVALTTNYTGATPTITSPAGAKYSHVLTVTATDQYLNTATSSVSYTIDASPPVITISGVTANTTINKTSLPLTLSCNKTCTTYSAVDIATPTTGIAVTTNYTGASPTITSPTGAMFSHVVTVTTTDQYGNTGTNSVSYTVDAVPPVITISGVTAGSTTNQTNLPLTLGCTGKTCTYATVDVATPPTGVALTTTYSGSTPTITSPAGAKNSHVLTVTATDQYGNTATNSVSYTIDAIPPVVTISGVTASSTTNQTNLPLTLGCTGKTCTYATVDVATPVTGSAITTNYTGATPTITSPAGAKYSHVLTVTATDQYLNTATSFVSYTIDASPPVVTIAGVTAGSTTNKTSLPLTLGCTGKTCTYAIVDVATPITGAAVTTNFTGATPTITSPAGVKYSHVLTVTATDQYGNTGTNSVSYTIDAVPPVITITGVTAGSTTNQTSLPLTLGCTGKTCTYATVDVATPTTGAALTTNYTGATPTITSPAGAKNSHVLTVTATDQFGNTATSAISYTIDAVLPLITISGVTTASTTNQISLPMTLGCTGKTCTYAIVDVATPPTGVALTTNYTGSTPTITSPAGAKYSHVLTVTATDQYLNTATSSVSYTVDAVPPIITISGVTASSTTNQTSLPLTLGCTGKTCTYAIVDVATPPTGVALTTNYTGATPTITSPAGAKYSHVLTVTATDQYLNTATGSVSYTVDAVPPIITISGVTAGSTTNQTSLPLTLGCTGKTCTYATVDVATPTTGVAVTTNYSGSTPTITSPAGTKYSHVLTVTATDQYLNIATSSVSYTIDNSPPVITITGVAANTTLSTTSLALTLACNKTCTYSISDVATPTSGTATTTNYTGSPITLAFAVGTKYSHLVTVTGTDQYLNTATSSVSFIVDTTAPVMGTVTCPASMTGTTSYAFSNLTCNQTSGCQYYSSLQNLTTGYFTTPKLVNSTVSTTAVTDSYTSLNSTIPYAYWVYAQNSLGVQSTSTPVCTTTTAAFDVRLFTSTSLTGNASTLALSTTSPFAQFNSTPQYSSLSSAAYVNISTNSLIIGAGHTLVITTNNLEGNSYVYLPVNNLITSNSSNLPIVQTPQANSTTYQTAAARLALNITTTTIAGKSYVQIPNLSALLSFVNPYVYQQRGYTPTYISGYTPPWFCGSSCGLYWVPESMNCDVGGLFWTGSFSLQVTP